MNKKKSKRPFNELPDYFKLNNTEHYFKVNMFFKATGLCL